MFIQSPLCSHPDPILPCAAPNMDALRVDEAALRRAWESSQRSTKEDWAEWMRHFAVELLRHSPSPALRATYPLAQVLQDNTIFLHLTSLVLSLDLCRGKSWGNLRGVMNLVCKLL